MSEERKRDGVKAFIIEEATWEEFLSNPSTPKLGCMSEREKQSLIDWFEIRKDARKALLNKIPGTDDYERSQKDFENIRRKHVETYEDVIDRECVRSFMGFINNITSHSRGVRIRI